MNKKIIIRIGVLFVLAAMIPIRRPTMLLIGGALLRRFCSRIRRRARASAWGGFVSS